MNARFFFLFLGLFGLYVQGIRAEEIPLDTLLTRYYNRAAGLMEGGEYDSAQYYFNKAFATPGVKDSPVYPVLMNEQGTLYFYIGEYAKSMEMKKSALPYLPKVSDLEKHISVYSDLGVLYRRFNQNDSAIYCYDKALKLALEYEDQSWIANLCMNLSVFYFNLTRPEDAEKYIDQAVVHIEKADDPSTEMHVWQKRGIIKTELDKKDEARESLQKAWQLACGKDGNADWQMFCMPTLVNFFNREGRKDSVMYYLEIGEKLLPSLPPMSASAQGFVQTKIEMDFRYGNYRKALQGMEMLRTWDKSGLVMKPYYRKMAVCYHELGEGKKAYAYMDSARMWTDSLAQDDIRARMTEFNSKFQAQEKELEINRLKQEQLERDALWMQVGIAAVLLMGVLAIALLRVKQKGELDAARKYIEGLENERKRFAKELHDGIANDLLGLQMQMSVAREKEDVERMGSRIGEMRENVRRISHELMPPEFSHLNLDEILSHYLQHLEKPTGIRIVYHAEPDVDWQLIPHRVAYEVYRIVQEWVGNILKYAGASRVEVSLTACGKGNFELAIVDDGKGMRDADRKCYGIGLRTVEDRAKSISATLTQTSSDKGSRFVMVFSCK